MFTSVARKKLQQALNAATDPAEITRLSAQLTKLMDAEGRARGRRQRAPVRAEQANAAKPTPADGAELFILHTPRNRPP